MGARSRIISPFAPIIPLAAAATAAVVSSRRRWWRFGSGWDEMSRESFTPRPCFCASPCPCAGPCPCTRSCPTLCDFASVGDHIRSELELVFGPGLGLGFDLVRIAWWVMGRTELRDRRRTKRGNSRWRGWGELVPPSLPSSSSPCFSSDNKTSSSSSS